MTSSQIKGSKTIARVREHKSSEWEAIHTSMCKDERALSRLVQTDTLISKRLVGRKGSMVGIKIPVAGTTGGAVPAA